MARALSVDLRRRVVGAIEGGLSYRAAAERFGVSPSSAIRWRAQEQREGDVTPKRQGGDRHSHRIEAHAELILSALAAKSDVTLAELRDGLKERGVAVAIGTLWRFFKRRRITRKKRRRTRSSCSSNHASRAAFTMLRRCSANVVDPLKTPTAIEAGTFMTFKSRPECPLHVDSTVPFARILLKKSASVRFGGKRAGLEMR